jgi:hypothetical protein
VTVLWILLAILLAGVTVIAFSLPWTQARIEAWIDERLER